MALQVEQLQQNAQDMTKDALAKELPQGDRVAVGTSDCTTNVNTDLSLKRLKSPSSLPIYVLLNWLTSKNKHAVRCNLAKRIWLRLYRPGEGKTVFFYIFLVFG